MGIVQNPRKICILPKRCFRKIVGVGLEITKVVWLGTNLALLSTNLALLSTNEVLLSTNIGLLCTNLVLLSTNLVPTRYY